MDGLWENFIENNYRTHWSDRIKKFRLLMRILKPTSILKTLKIDCISGKKRNVYHFLYYVGSGVITASFKPQLNVIINRTTHRNKLITMRSIAFYIFSLFLNIRPCGALALSRNFFLPIILMVIKLISGGIIICIILWVALMVNK